MNLLHHTAIHGSFSQVSYAWISFTIQLFMDLLHNPAIRGSPSQSSYTWNSFTIQLFMDLLHNPAIHGSSSQSSYTWLLFTIQLYMDLLHRRRLPYMTFSRHTHMSLYGTSLTSNNNSALRALRFIHASVHMGTKIKEDQSTSCRRDRRDVAKSGEGQLRGETACWDMWLSQRRGNLGK